ncbi:hypothetical protein EBU58_02810, partial [bacterium]|nr:hypothetical protein [bacterium]
MWTLLLIAALLSLRAPALAAEPPLQVPGTEAFPPGTDFSADALASELVAGVDQFLLDEIAAAREERRTRWLVEHATRELAAASDEERRSRLA